MPFGNSQTDVPKGQLKIAGATTAPGQVPKGRLNEGASGLVQSSLRDSNWIDDVPGVETPGYSWVVPPGHGLIEFPKGSTGKGDIQTLKLIGLMKTNNHLLALSLIAGCLATSTWSAWTAEPPAKPVLLYSRYYNAEGENRYLPDDTYKQVMERLRQDFDVRVHNKPLTRETLNGVKLLFIVNPSDKAVGDHPPPPHVSMADIKVLSDFVAQGGGLIVSGNQENHNLEVEDMNKLLAQFGIQTTNLYTDAKKLVLPEETPVIGGLRWAYYTGNLLLLEPTNPAKPRALVLNDLNQKPPKGT